MVQTHLRCALVAKRPAWDYDTISNSVSRYIIVLCCGLKVIYVSELFISSRFYFSCLIYSCSLYIFNYSFWNLNRLFNTDVIYIFSIHKYLLVKPGRLCWPIFDLIATKPTRKLRLESEVSWKFHHNRSSDFWFYRKFTYMYIHTYTQWLLSTIYTYIHRLIIKIN